LAQLTLEIKLFTGIEAKLLQSRKLDYPEASTEHVLPQPLLRVVWFCETKPWRCIGYTYPWLCIQPQKGQHICGKCSEKRTSGMYICPDTLSSSRRRLQSAKPTENDFQNIARIAALPVANPEFGLGRTMSVRGPSRSDSLPIAQYGLKVTLSDLDITFTV
jgi:hypothetical protein